MAECISDAINELAARIQKHSPNTPKLKYAKKVKDPHMLEVSVFDAHFGKLCWGEETGTNYDLKIAEQVYKQAVQDLNAKTQSFNVDKILFPIGSDFFHVNNPNNTTAKGTPQDADERLKKIFQVGHMAIVHCLDELSARAPVHVTWVPGNHDPDVSWYLAKTIEAWYRNNPNITVDATPTARKYIKYGMCLLGITHGNEEKHADLPTLMAQEAAQDWAATDGGHREWHVGHLHKRKETRFIAGDTHVGVPVKILPSLSGTDAWHYRKGYVKAKRAADAYLWSFKDGYAGHFVANARQIDKV